MWVRSAFWVGRPSAGHDAEFRRKILDVLSPGLKALPGVQGVRVLWPRRLEDSPPEIFCQILVEFAKQADIDLMLASPGRQELRREVRAIAERFEGAISHIDYEAA
jgi:hypothetical protein